MISYCLYSIWVYTAGTDTAECMSVHEADGKAIFERHNCESCHQLFGLGGYLGPELTTVISDPTRGALYARAVLQAGGSRMPDFHFSEAEIDALIAYLAYVDRSATTYKKSVQTGGL